MPMTFVEYWLRLCRKQPQLIKEDTKMTISVGAFQRALKRAFEANKTEDAAEAFGNISSSGTDDPQQILRDIFGRKR